MPRYVFDSSALLKRYLDAVHLALALDLFRQRKVDIFVSADNVQCEVAKLEGLPTINPVAAIP